MVGARKATGGLIAFLSVAEIAFAITIIVLVADQLNPGAGSYYSCYWDYSTNQQVCGNWYTSGVCLMTDNSVNVCRYSYAAAVIGIVASIVTLCAMCLPAAVTLLMSLFGFVWWLGYAITATVFSNNVENQEFTLTLPGGQELTKQWGYPRGNYRTMVYALAWTTFSCCVVSTLLAVAMMRGGDRKDAPPAVDKAGMYEEPVKPAGNPPATTVV